MDLQEINFENATNVDGMNSIGLSSRYSTDPGIPFHLLHRQRISNSQAVKQIRESQNAVHSLEDIYHEFCDKKIRDSLSCFLPQLPGFVDAPGTPEDSLQGLIEKPPIGGRELAPLSSSALSSFRLMPGSVPEQFKFMNRPPGKKKKHKKHKLQEETDIATGDAVDRKHKKKKKEEGDKKKKKKEKRKKKEKKTVDGLST